MADEIQITPALLDAIAQAESGGRPSVVNPKSGAVGKYQILPSTGAMFGVPRERLFDPDLSRRIASVYLQGLVKKYGNLPQALAVYHGEAGADKVYSTPSSYVRGIISRIGESTANAAETPYTGPILSEKPKTETPYTGPILSEKPKHIRMEIKKEIPLPLGARVAGYLPAAGQLAGEALGAGGAALIPGVGETGVGEYGGAVAGGAGGSVLGAEAENAIRKAYGLPPISVGTEAAIGGGTSAVGGLLPPVLRTRAAGAIGRATKRAFGPALEAAEGLKGELERRLGTTATRAAGRISEAAQPVIRAYRGTLNAGLKALGTQYDSALAPFRFIPVGDTASTVLNGRAGQLLDMSGKPLRKAIQDEINAQPMTVTRAQEVLSFIKQWRRTLDPDTQRMAGSAIDQVQKALETDRDRVVGPAVAQRLKALDAQYAQQLARFPMKAVRKTTTEAGAADAILKAKPNEAGRVVDVIKQMRDTGTAARARLNQLFPTGNVPATARQNAAIGRLMRLSQALPVLKQATATKIFAGAEAKAGLNEAERIVNVRKAVEAIPRQVFDELYGQGARDSWLQLAKDFEAKQAEILKNPTEAKAIQAEVRKFLQSPTAGQAAYNYLKHHLGWVALGLATGHYGAGVGVGEEAGLAVGALFGIKMWEGIAHSRLAMHYMEQAATSKSTERTARLIFAAIDAAAHAGIQEQTADTTMEANP